MSKEKTLLQVLNEEPNPKIIKTYEGKDGAKYIPIGILQTMLDEVFDGYWSWESKIQLTDKTVAVSGNLHYTYANENFKEYIAEVRSGVGAVSLKGDPNMLVPIAEAFAFKNACKKIGKRFGADLNREETLEYRGLPILGKK
jgi:hypothetical protein